MYLLNKDCAPVGGHSFKDLRLKRSNLCGGWKRVSSTGKTREEFHPAERLAGYSKMKNCECRMQRESSARGEL